MSERVGCHRSADRLCEPGRRPGRAGVRRWLHGDGPGRPGGSRAPRFVEDLAWSMCPWLPAEPVARPVIHVVGHGDLRRARGGTGARRWRASPTGPRSSGRRSVLGTADYVSQERFHRRGRGALGWRRLRASGSDRRRRARCGAHPRRAHAVSRTRATIRCTDAEELADNLGLDRRTIEIEPAHDAFSGCWRRRSTAGRGPHRGEPPVADPGGAADGPVEQVRMAGAHDGEQERDRGGLLHALRRLQRVAWRSSRTCRS